jgi:hypothetical protein
MKPEPEWEFLTKTIFDPAIFWAMVTAVATVFLVFFAVLPLREIAKTRRTVYGTVTFKFEAGRIVIINKNETLKPSELPGQPGKRKDETLQHQKTCSD